ncbi:unnamed protein product [Mortierella alpina]
MRFTSFVPAVMALSLFSASTQALPALSQDRAVALLKRRDSPDLADAVVKLFVGVSAKAALDACVDLEAKVCADVDLTLKADVNAANIVKVAAAVKTAQAIVKANVDVDVKAHVRAEVEAKVVAPIDAHVHAVLAVICPVLNNACLHDNAHKIVTDVYALIEADIKHLVVDINAKLDAFVKVRVYIHIKQLSINLLNLIGAKLNAIVVIKTDIQVHLKAFVDLCLKVAAKVKLTAAVGAL